MDRFTQKRCAIVFCRYLLDNGENWKQNCVLIQVLLGQIDRMGVGRILFSLEVASSILELFPPSPCLAR